MMGTKLHKFCLLSIVAGLMFTACGSDSKSPSGSEENNPESSEKKDTEDENGDKFVSGSDEESPYIIDSTYDYYNDEYIYTIQSGYLLWTSELVTGTSYSVSSMCYDNKSSNCDTYGRLYKSDFADYLCPSNYHIPSKEEWKQLSGLLSDGDLDSLTNFAYGGGCTEKKDTTKCSGLKTTAYYLSANDSVFVKSANSSSYSFIKANPKGYYSLRCVSSTGIVKDLSDLPTCTKDQEGKSNRFYVFNEKQNFYCTGSRWVEDLTDDCNRSGKVFTVGDTTMICTSGSWQLASISYAPQKCTEEKEGVLLQYNGSKYACEDESWRRFNDIENSLGYCNEKKLLKIDTIITNRDTLSYICDTLGSWRYTTIEDFGGVCDSNKHHLDTLLYKGQNYICRNGDWEGFRTLDEKYGACTQKRHMFYNNGSKVFSDTVNYICDTTETYGWRYYTIDDVKGTCTTAREGEDVVYSRNDYRCHNQSWYKMTYIEKGIGICDSTIQGTIKTYKSGSDTTTYICRNSGWSKAYTSDVLTTCDKSNEADTVRLHYSLYYCNGNGKWNTYSPTQPMCTISRVGSIDSVSSTAYIYTCDTTGWKGSSMVSYRLGTCTSEQKGDVKSYNGVYYSCSGSSWSKLSGYAATFGPCTEKIEGIVQVSGDTAVQCLSGSWTKISAVEAKYGPCDSTSLGKYVALGSSYYACKNAKTWASITEKEYSLGDCTKDKEGNTAKYSTSFYMCKSGSWTTVSEMIYTIGTCTTANSGEIKKYNGTNYKCSGSSWGAITSKEAAIGTCTADREAETALYDGITYRCNSKYWYTIGINSKLCNDDTRLTNATNNGISYTCRDSSDIWYQSSAPEIAEKYCTKKTLGDLYEDVEGSQWYVCKNYSPRRWDKLDKAIAELGVCRNATTKTFKRASNNKIYGCYPNKIVWLEAALDSVLGKCLTTSSYSTGVFEGTTYICDPDYKTGWMLQPTDPLYCSHERNGETTLIDDVPYICTKSKWVKTTFKEYMGTCTASRDGEKVFNGVCMSTCTSGEWVRSEKATFTDTRDSRSYNIAKIGTQTWISTAMKYSTSGSICQEETSGCTRVYPKSDASKVCPTGWRAATETDWSTLFNYLKSIDSFTYTTYSKTGDMKNIAAYGKMIGIEFDNTVAQIYYLQNGQDPIYKMSAIDGITMWTDTTYYTVGYDYVSSFRNSIQYQDYQITKREVRCIKDSN